MEANETTGSLKEIGKSDPLEIGSRINIRHIHTFYGSISCLFLIILFHLFTHHAPPI